MDEMRCVRNQYRIMEVPLYKQEIMEGIPDEEELLPAIIRIFKDNGELTLEELRQRLKELFWMDDNSFSFKFENSRRSLFGARVYRIVYHLFRHFLLERTARGTYILTRWGKQIAECYPQIRYDEIKRFPRRIPEYEYDFEEGAPYRNYRDPEYQHDELFENYNINVSFFGFPIRVEEFIEQEELWVKITEEEFWLLYNNDTRFRNLVRTGRVIFQSGRIIPIRYELGEGKYSSLVLKASYDYNLRIEVRKNIKTNTVYFKDVYYLNRPINRMEFLTICKKPLDWDNSKTDDIIERLLRELPDTPIEIYEYLKRELNIQWGKLADVMGVSVRQLQNWRKAKEGSEEETRNTIGLRNLVAFCLALQLPPELSEEILKRVGAVDQNGDPYDPDAAGGDQRVWQYILKRHYIKTPLEINELCKKNGIECLFPQNKKENKDDSKVDHGVVRKDKK